MSFLDAPSSYAAAIVPSDASNLPTPALSIYVGVSGNLHVLTEGGSEVTFLNVPVGIFHVRARRVYATGTTATELIALS
jgi:hypothetical protein